MIFFHIIYCEDLFFFYIRLTSPIIHKTIRVFCFHLIWVHWVFRKETGGSRQTFGIISTFTWTTLTLFSFQYHSVLLHPPGSLGAGTLVKRNSLPGSEWKTAVKATLVSLDLIHRSKLLILKNTRLAMLTEQVVLKPSKARGKRISLFTSFGCHLPILINLVNFATFSDLRAPGTTPCLYPWPTCRHAHTPDIFLTFSLCHENMFSVRFLSQYFNFAFCPGAPVQLLNH